MTKTLRKAIEALLKILHENTNAAGMPAVDESYLIDLEKAYQDQRATMTETSKRVEFLEDCLETGVSKREAARMLAADNPRIGRGTAETLVYLNFSGRYQTTLRGRRRLKPKEITTIVTAGVTPDVSDDESIL